MSATAPTATPAADQILIGGLSLAWIANVAEIVRRDGNALRPGAGPWIEAQSINNGLWYPIVLEGKRDGDVFLESIADRDAVLAEIIRLSAKTPAEPDSFFSPETRAQATATLNTMAAVAAR